MIGDERETTITLAARTGRDFGAHGQVIVSAHGVTGRGRILADARQDWRDRVRELLTLAQSVPRVGVDDDGSTLVTYPLGTGWETVRVSPDGTWSTWYGDYPGVTAHHVRELARDGRPAATSPA